MRSRLCGVLVTAIMAAGSCGLCAQKEALQRHEQVEGSFTALAYVDSAKYIGYGVEYTWSPRRWIGAGGGFSGSNSNQVLTLKDTYVGSDLKYGYGFVRSGWAFRRVGMYAVVAGGRTTSNVFDGVDQNNNALFRAYASPTLCVGGKFEITVTRRLTLNYAVYDKLQFFGDLPVSEPNILGGPYTYHGLTQQTQEVRVGVGFHF